MGLFDDSDFDEQLWTDAWIEEVDEESRRAFAAAHAEDFRDEIQDDIDSGLFTREEIMEMHCLDEDDLDDYDTSLLP